MVTTLHNVNKHQQQNNEIETENTKSFLQHELAAYTTSTESWNKKKHNTEEVKNKHKRTSEWVCVFSISYKWRKKAHEEKWDSKVK